MNNYVPQYNNKNTQNNKNNNYNTFEQIIYDLINIIIPSGIIYCIIFFIIFFV